ncbi:elongation factor P [Candidatus Pelagibacter sp.]|nr:elongation factor P [Candidatus Pelagibacter sp.]
MKINAGEIKVGMLLEYKNDLWQVLKTQHVKPGKGGAFAQVEMKSLNKSTKLNERFRSNESVEKASLEDVTYNYLYSDEEKLFFIEPKSFEQIELAKNLVGEKSKLLMENLEVTISFYNDKPVSLELPKNITCVIETTDVALKGQTISSSYKPAKLNNGLNIQVPPFIESGDEIIIDTRNLEYVKKI